MNKFEIVAENFQNELLQIKTSKVSALTEGGRSGYQDFYIFELEAVILILGPLVTIILSNRNISTHNNGGYKMHYRCNKKNKKTIVLNDCNIKILVIEFGREFLIF